MKFTAERIHKGEVIQKPFEAICIQNKRLNITTVTIIDGKKTFRYFLSEFQPDKKDFAGRAFKLTKEDDSAQYNCLIAQASHGHSCDCPGFIYTQKCKHISSLIKLLKESD